MKSYQPKPTGEGYAPNRCEKHGTGYFNVCPNCAEEIHITPKPTGEWTRDGTLIWCDGKIVPDIVTAHNAALAAVRRERQAWEDDAKRYAINSDHYRKQLAAERETTDPATGDTITKPSWAEIAAMSQDTGRLDWLEQHEASWPNLDILMRFTNIRAAIDQQIKKEQ